MDCLGDDGQVILVINATDVHTPILSLPHLLLSDERTLTATRVDTHLAAQLPAWVLVCGRNAPLVFTRASWAKYEKKLYIIVLHSILRTTSHLSPLARCRLVLGARFRW